MDNQLSLGTRHIICALGFFGMFNVNCMRHCLSVTIIAMVNSTDHEEYHKNDMPATLHVCPDRLVQVSNISYQMAEMKQGEFNWGPAMQGSILGAYFYGYILSNILGGYLCTRYGVRYVLGIQMLLSSCLTILSPFVAKSAGYNVFFVIRILLGFLQGTSFPAMICCWKNWAATYEQSFFTTIHSCGGIFGTVAIFPVAGALGQYLGWEWVFYTTGVVSLLWSVIWMSYVRNLPEEHPTISETEKKFIICNRNSKNVANHYCTQIPLLKILKSKAVWALIVPHFAMQWGMNMLELMLPTYMSTVLKFNLVKSGIYSAFPYIIYGVIILSGGWITDRVRKTGRFRTIHVRKFNTVAGLLPPALFLVLAGHVGCDLVAAIALFAVSIAFLALVVPGCESNVFDIAPKCPEIVFAISNTVASTPGFIAPSIVGLILEDDPSMQRWQVAFYIAGGVYVFGALFYVLAGTDESQKWGVFKNQSTECMKTVAINTVSNKSKCTFETIDMDKQHKQENDKVALEKTNSI